MSRKLLPDFFGVNWPSNSAISWLDHFTSRFETRVVMGARFETHRPAVPATFFRDAVSAITPYGGST